MTHAHVGCVLEIMGGDHRQNSALDKRRCFRLRGGAFMCSVLDGGGPSGPYVVVLSERWWCFYTMCFRQKHLLLSSASILAVITSHMKLERV